MSWTDELSAANWAFFIIGCFIALVFLFLAASYIYIKVKFKGKRYFLIPARAMQIIALLAIVFISVGLGVPLRSRRNRENLKVKHGQKHDEIEVFNLLKQVQETDLDDIFFAEGNGIGLIVCSGGARTREAAGGLGYLRELERREGLEPLPIEWYFVGDEMDSKTIQELESWLGNIEFIDVQDERLKSYAIKPYALTQSKFQHVILVDSDSVPLVHPTKVMKESKQYRDYGNLFFKDPAWKYQPDLAHPKFRNAYKDADQADKAYGTHDTESGQFFIDRNRWKNALLYAWKLNDHMDLIYRATFGDKDTFIVGFALNGQVEEYQQMETVPLILIAPYDMKVNRERVAFVHFDSKKQPIFFHRHGQKKNCTMHSKMCFTDVKNFYKLPENLKSAVKSIGDQEKIFDVRTRT